MMVSPGTFIMNYSKCSYAELIKVRDELINEIREYEQQEMTGNRNSEEWMIMPSPDVRYQMNFDYLAELLRLMSEKYQEDTVMVDEHSNVADQIQFIRNIIWSVDEPYLYRESVYKHAIKLLGKLVKAGNAEAMNLKGAMYYEGRGVEQDRKKAVTWYKKAADAGDSLAMSNLGYAYFYGNGTAVNMAQAYKYFSMAVQRGEWDAINMLGDMYRDGIYVPKDTKMAVALYDRCYNIVPHDANNDAYPACLVRLAECLYRGEGVITNHIRGYKLLKDAEAVLEIQIDNGNYYAPKAMERVKKDIAEVEALQEEINNIVQVFNNPDD